MRKKILNTYMDLDEGQNQGHEALSHLLPDIIIVGFNLLLDLIKILAYYFALYGEVITHTERVHD